MLYFIYISIIIDSISGYLINPDLEENLPQYYCGSDNLTFYNHTPFSYVIEESNLCFGEVFLLIYVHTSWYNFEKRMVIRETFGSLRFVDNDPVRLLFIIGRSQDTNTQTWVEKESESYRDIVQADFEDTYYNLTLKHIVALHWINRFCGHAQFVSKTDDDTFVNIYRLVWYLRKNFYSEQKFIIGRIWRNEHPIRDKSSKFYVSTEMYPDKSYPPFIKRESYVMSRGSIKPLFVCSYYQRFFYLDDVFVSGLVSKLARVILVEFEEFYGNKWITKENVLFDEMENVFLVTLREYDPEQWKILWFNVLKMEQTLQ